MSDKLEKRKIEYIYDPKKNTAKAVVKEYGQKDILLAVTMCKDIVASFGKRFNDDDSLTNSDEEKEMIVGLATSAFTFLSYIQDAGRKTIKNQNDIMNQINDILNNNDETD
jgi:hypothetical protein